MGGGSLQSYMGLKVQTFHHVFFKYGGDDYVKY
jgi:hypothetical protein